MNKTLTDGQREIIVDALNFYHSRFMEISFLLPAKLRYKLRDKVYCLIELFESDKYITISDSQPTPY